MTDEEDIDPIVAEARRKREAERQTIVTRADAYMGELRRQAEDHKREERSQLDLHEKERRGRRAEDILRGLVPRNRIT